MNPNPLPPPIEHRFKPGHPSKGSAPKGKRISTWMAEFGDMPPSKWPNPEKLSANGRIAMARVLKAMTQDGIRDTEMILDRTEGAVAPEPAAPMLQAIAAAILALKASGVDVRRNAIASEAVEKVMTLPAPDVETLPTEEDDEDETQRTKRLRRGRS